MSSTSTDAAIIDVRPLYLFYLTAALLVLSFLPFFASAGSVATSSATSTPASVESQVKDFFKDTPVMVAIARCESGLRQFGPDGKVLRGGAGGGMVGVFQIYESVHLSAARGLGFDLTTLAGNMGYAKHLYTAEGTAPWNSAKSCWGSAPETKITEVKDSKAKAVSRTDTKANTKRTETKRELEAKVRTLKKLLAQLQELLAEQKRRTARN